MTNYNTSGNSISNDSVPLLTEGTVGGGVRDRPPLTDYLSHAATITTWSANEGNTTHIDVDPVDQTVWILDRENNQLVQYDRLGSATGSTISIPQGREEFGFDRNSPEFWLLNGDTYEKYDRSGTQVTSFTYPENVLEWAPDAYSDNVVIWGYWGSSFPFNYAFEVYASDGSELSSFSISSGDSYGSIGVDGTGDAYVSNTSDGAIDLLTRDPSGFTSIIEGHRSPDISFHRMGPYDNSVWHIDGYGNVTHYVMTKSPIGKDASGYYQLTTGLTEYDGRLESDRSL